MVVVSKKHNPYLARIIISVFREIFYYIRYTLSFNNIMLIAGMFVFLLIIIQTGSDDIKLFKELKIINMQLIVPILSKYYFYSSFIVYFLVSFLKKKIKYRPSTKLKVLILALFYFLIIALSYIKIGLIFVSLMFLFFFFCHLVYFLFVVFINKFFIDRIIFLLDKVFSQSEGTSFYQ